MNHIALLIIVVVLILPGCVTTKLAKPTEQLGRIGIIPVECYPLMITPRNETESNSLKAYIETLDYQNGDFRIYIPGGKADFPDQFKSPVMTYPGLSGSQTGGIVSIVGVVGALVNASLEEGSSEGSQIQSEERSSGMLINEIPEITRNLLYDSDFQNVSMINGYVQLPIADRSLNPSLSNWRQPLSSYVKSNTPAIDYSTIDGGPYDTILEVGIVSFEFYEGRLSLQVFMKLIDVPTNQVIGSTRKINFFAKKQQLDTLLENDAEGLKQLIRSTAKKLLAECLVVVGVISKAESK